MSKIFDSHCHPQFPQYDADREETLARAETSGVAMIAVGTDLKTSEQAIALAQKHDGIWATAGIHPNNVDSLSLNNLPGLEELLKQEKVVGIGEVGLDHYRTPDPERQNLQKIFLKEIFELALRHDKPLVLHVRDAAQGSLGRIHAELIEILDSSVEMDTYTNSDIKVDDRRVILEKESIIKNIIVDQEKNKINKTSETKLRGVAHSFTGTKTEAQLYLDRGFYLGFNGIITFSNQYDEVVKHVPLGRILLETDAPYLTPEPFRGQRNEPAYVDNICRRVAFLKGVSEEEVAQVTSTNCRALFRLKD